MWMVWSSNTNKMIIFGYDLAAIIVPIPVLISVAVMLIIVVIQVVIYYLTLKKKQQEFINSSQFKKLSKDLDKIKLKDVKVVAKKEVHEPKGFSFQKANSKFTLEYWKMWYKEKYFPAKIVMINMELINGFHRSMTVIEKDGGFVFRGKKYIFDDDSKYYNMDAKLYVFDFHENLVLPVRRKIPVTAIKKTIESTEEIDIEYAINPSTLQRFMTAKIAEGVMKGTMLDEFLRKLQMFIIVIMVAVLVHLALFIYASGILQNIQMPF